MAQLHQLRRDLRFNTEFLQLILTLKNIAASQYHMLEREKERFAAFMDEFAGFFKVVDSVGVDNPLVRSATDVLGVVLVTSDSGFMGSLNVAVIAAALQAQGDLSNDKVHLIVIGEKGAGKLQELNRPYKFFQGIAEETRYEQAMEIRDYLVKEVMEKRIGRLLLAYPRPISFTQQTVDVIGILPCADLFDRSPSEAGPVAPAGDGLLARTRRVVVESSFDDMVAYLASVWVASKLYEVFEDAKLSEYAARAMHLEDSGQKLERELKKLKHQCFRASHELVDKGMRESFSARKKKRKKAA